MGGESCQVSAEASGGKGHERRSKKSKGPKVGKKYGTEHGLGTVVDATLDLTYSQLVILDVHFM